MSAAMFLPDTDLLRLDAIAPEDGAITLVLATIQIAPRCPECGEPAMRVHSRYVCSSGDLPCGGVPLRLELHARRLYCDTGNCPRRIFTERLPGVLKPYARRTNRLAEALQAVAYELGGKAGRALPIDWECAPAATRSYAG